ncbi:MAG: penicillin-binding transpeptidase domain-containing protein [Deltaproteobacteria bacterium]
MKKQRHQSSEMRPILLAAALLLFCGLWFIVPQIFALVAGGGTPCSKDKTGDEVSTNPGLMLRGNIYDRRGIPLAISLPLFSVYVKPVELQADRKQVDFLAAALKIAPESLEKQLKSERCVVWLARYIPPRIAEEIRQKQIRGLYLISEPQRYYPQGKIGSHVVGCFKDGHGLAGIEFNLDQVLQISEPVAGLAAPFLSPMTHAKKNRHVILQLDTGLQKMVAIKLAELQKKTSATAVWGVVMEPSSGAVLAMVSLPAYDPNRFWEFSEDTLVNRAAENRFSIGSLAGLFSLAEALDSGKGLGETGGSTGFGKSDELQKSEADDFVSDSLGRLLSLAPAASLTELNKFFQAGSPQAAKAEAAVSAQQDKQAFREEVSALQLLSGFSSLVNGGRVPQPRLVWEICNCEGKAPDGKEAPVSEVLKPETSGILRALLNSGGSGSLLFCSLREKGGHEQNNGPEKGDRVTQETTPRQGIPFDAVVLGYLPGKKGDCVLAIVLQDGDNAFGFRKKSWQGVANAILKKSVGVLAAGPVSLTASNFRVDVEAAYARWRRIQEKVADDKDQRSVPAKKELMPKVTGLSLRKALHILQPLELPCSIKGSGVVVAQHPKPGMPMGRGRISLRLQKDVGVIRGM